MARMPTLVPGVVGVVVAAALAGTAAADDRGSITGTVTVVDDADPGDPGDPGEGACVLIGVDRVDFGSLAFGESGFSDPYAVESCATGDQVLLGHATNATNAAGTVTWNLVDHWDLQQRNDYVVVAVFTEGNDILGGGPLQLEPAVGLPYFSASTSLSARNQLVMPPSGDGGGETMSFEIVYTALVLASE
jgi:hypothetical protein